MKNLRQVINEAEKSKLQKEYDKYFTAKLKEYDVDSPAELSDDDKKKFFSEVEKGWTEGKGEKTNESEDEEIEDEESEDEETEAKVKKDGEVAKEEIEDNEEEIEEEEGVVNESLKSFDAVKISTELLKQKNPTVEFIQLITDILEQVYENADDTDLAMDMADAAIKDLTKLSQELQNM